MINVSAADETRYAYGIGLRSTGNMGNMKIYHNTPWKYFEVIVKIYRCS